MSCHIKNKKTHTPFKNNTLNSLVPLIQDFFFLLYRKVIQEHVTLILIFFTSKKYKKTKTI